MNSNSRLIVALDLPTVSEAKNLVLKLKGSINFFKIGLELIYSGGIQLVKELKDEGNQIFLDAKLLDIPNTVEKSTANIARIGADFLTVHGHDEATLTAALKGRGTNPLKILSVTVLTSIDNKIIEEQGYNIKIEELVIRRARLAKEIGVDGIVASPNESRKIREQIGNDFTIITPGIRLNDDSYNDQKRINTPREAIKSGANYLVVGRPITQAKDPYSKAMEFLEQIDLD